MGSGMFTQFDDKLHRQGLIILLILEMDPMWPLGDRRCHRIRAE